MFSNIMDVSNSILLQRTETRMLDLASKVLEIKDFTLDELYVSDNVSKEHNIQLVNIPDDVRPVEHFSNLELPESYIYVAEDSKHFKKLWRLQEDLSHLHSELFYQILDIMNEIESSSSVSKEKKNLYFNQFSYLTTLTFNQFVFLNPSQGLSGFIKHIILWLDGLGFYQKYSSLKATQLLKICLVLNPPKNLIQDELRKSIDRGITPSIVKD